MAARRVQPHPQLELPTLLAHALALAVPALQQPAGIEQPLAGPPSCVIFVLDDVASADLSLYGGPIRTPNLDKLARAGVLFTRAYANPTCAPTRRSLLTGHHWVAANGEACVAAGARTPKSSEVLLPEALPLHKSMLVGKWHLGGDPEGGRWECAPVTHGFDLWLAGSAGNVRNCDGLNYWQWTRADAGPEGCASTTSTTNEPIAVRSAFLENWKKSERWLAVVCSNLAHEPFHSPPRNLLPRGHVVPDKLRGQFEAMVMAQDTLIGQMMAAVDLSTTLVVVVGDNGTPPKVAPGRNRAKETTFERGVRVPLIVAGAPVVSPGRVSGELVHVVDVWKTVIDVCGGSLGETPHPSASVSLVPVLRDEPHEPLHEAVFFGWQWGAPGGEVAAVSRAGLKLRQVDENGDRVADVEELYDLTQDPNETRNLAGDASHAAALGELRAEIERSVLP
jgi:arylsulfatase